MTYRDIPSATQDLIKRFENSEQGFVSKVYFDNRLITVESAALMNDGYVNSASIWTLSLTRGRKRTYTRIVRAYPHNVYDCAIDSPESIQILHVLLEALMNQQSVVEALQEIAYHYRRRT